MKNSLSTFLVIIMCLVNTGCFSLLIRKYNSDEETYRAQVKLQQDEAAKKYKSAKDIYLATPNLEGMKKAIAYCQTIESLFEQRMCYADVFTFNKDKAVCKDFVNNSIAQYTCYVQLLKEKKLLASEVKSFCPDKVCLGAYAYRHYGMEGSLPEFQSFRDEARKIESETGYHRQKNRISYPSRGLEFHEVLHLEARTNRAFGVGYDLNFKYDGSEIPSIGFGYYNLTENIYFLDVVVSGVQKPVAARLALGAEFKKGYDTRYHLLYALGLSVKSAGVAPLLEISSDFQKDHQVVLGLMFLFQPAR